jgi:hypothetical protein
MAEYFNALNQDHVAFIGAQSMFFVATADTDTLINISPKGMDSLRILDGNRLVWLNLTGSGNETYTHLQSSPRMTLMWCSFAKLPLILRVYGNATCILPSDDAWSDYAVLMPEQLGARQFFVLDIDVAQTSCGWAVPEMQLVRERPTLTKFAESVGVEQIKASWAKSRPRPRDFQAKEQ